MDKAHNQTEKELSKLEKELKKVYQEVYNSIRKQLVDTLAKMELEKAEDGMGKYNLATKYDRLTKLEHQIAETLVSVEKDGVSTINKTMRNIYGNNYDYVMDELLKNSRGALKSFPTLDNRVVKGILSDEYSPFVKLALDEALDKDIIRRSMARQLTHGIMQGESIPKIAKRVRSVIEKTLSDSVRIARTETTRVQNNARQDAITDGEKKGLIIEKYWVNPNDSRSRPAHAQANGTKANAEGLFEVGGEMLRFPGDINGSPENIINCRCTIISKVVGYNGKRF